jgi:hypothetical protein
MCISLALAIQHIGSFVKVKFFGQLICVAAHTKIHGKPVEHDFQLILCATRIYASCKIRLRRRRDHPTFALTLLYLVSDVTPLQFPLSQFPPSIESRFHIFRSHSHRAFATTMFPPRPPWYIRCATSSQRSIVDA